MNVDSRELFAEQSSTDQTENSQMNFMEKVYVMAALNRNPEQIFGLKEVENASTFFFGCNSWKIEGLGLGST